MNNGDFYESLPSNGSAKSFPNNTQSNFTTLLENPIELFGKYQVALVEISNFSNFSVNLGTIVFKNPFFGSVYENRAEFIEFEFRIENGVDLSQFCSKLNFQIQNNFIKTEYFFRQKLAFSRDADFIQEMQLINDSKKDVISGRRPLLNVLKSGPSYYEVIDNNDSIFMKLFVNAGGTFNVEKSRFIFSNIDILKTSFVLIIIRIPKEKEEMNIGNYFIDKAFYIKSDDFLLEPEMQEMAWPSNENLRFNFQNLSLIKEKNKNFSDKEFEFNEYFLFCPHFKLLNSTTLKLITNSEIRFKGVISQVLNNNEFENTIFSKDEIFMLNPYLQLTKFILVYCDIIEPQFYADKSSPILRTVNIKSQKNENVIFFDNPQYLNINRSRFNTINIELKDTQNNYIEFNDKFSNIFISLHFKSKK